MSKDIHPIVMPKWGLSMTEGMVAKWYFDEGAEISAGDVLADIETSKITNELQSHVAGVLRRRVADEGVELPCGALLGVIAAVDVSAEDVDAFVDQFTPESEPEEETPLQPPASQSAAGGTGVRKPDRASGAASGGQAAIPQPLTGSEDDSSVAATHHARKLVGKLGINLTRVSGTGRRGRISKADVIAAIERAGGRIPISVPASGHGTAPVNVDNSRVPATPLARRIAAQAGLNLNNVTPMGDGGRVTKSDVEKALALRGTGRPEKRVAERVWTGSNPLVAEGPLSNMRRVIAQRLVQSKQQAPHFRLSVDLKLDALLDLRAQLNADESVVKVSINDLLIKMSAAALMDVPQLNVQFDGHTLRWYQHADVAVAVALDEGLVTPVIRSADAKSVREIAREMSDLAERACDGILAPDEFEGGTFTISNLGMFGVDAFDAIINPPQVAILAVGGARKTWAVGDGGGVVAMMMKANLSCDHRVIDGALGARFLQAFRRYVENPISLFV